ncbi:class IV adenylate cyclase [Fodinicola acaciae]|uniref:class IV adenylate cyclase n=1 Tax=Fodinicola acaciae TaxID=2681555 RepID=UPI0013D8B493|nr:CYTH domain-containing protein [Fodinicola acaciae]
MPIQRREIEVKYRLHDTAAAVDQLAGHGFHLSPPVHQDDQAYAEPGWDYGQPKLGVAFARLRTQLGRHLFTLKKPQDNEMACLEHETEVADRDEMHAALLAMGFRPTVRIVKSRRTAARGDLSLCLDEVEHAGSFLEAETVVPPGRPGLEVQAELDRFVRSLNLDVERTTDTYDSLVRAALVSA